MGLSSSPPSSSTKMKLLLALTLLAAAASAQDTHHCPDGWFLYDRHGLIECFYMDNEWVSKSTANLICQSHGGWVAELDHPGINYWLKNLLFEQEEGAEQGNQWWLGATTEEQHSDHHPGTWWWPHFNRTVDWFDWADGEPNNMHRHENCVPSTSTGILSSQCSGTSTGMTWTALDLQ